MNHKIKPIKHVIIQLLPFYLVFGELAIYVFCIVIYFSWLFLLFCLLQLTHKLLISILIVGRGQCIRAISNTGWKVSSNNRYGMVWLFDKSVWLKWFCLQFNGIQLVCVSVTRMQFRWVSNLFWHFGYNIFWILSVFLKWGLKECGVVVSFYSDYFKRNGN